MSNFTPETAILISSLPYSTTVDVSGSTTPGTVTPSCGSANYPAWWLFTPAVGQTAMGIRVDTTNHAADYYPSVSVWVGSPSSLTQLSDVCMRQGPGSGMQIAVTPGTPYYILVADDSGSSPGAANLVFYADPAPDETVVLGALLIANDFANFPAAFLDPVTLDTLAIVGLPAFEQANMLPGGMMLVAAETSDGADDLASYNIYDASTLTLEQALTAEVITNGSILAPITSNKNDTWYVVRNPNGLPISVQPTVISITCTGVVGPVTWTLPYFTDFHAGVTCATLSLDGTTLIYSSGASAVHGQVATYDLTLNSPGTDLIAPTAFSSSGADLLTLADGTYLITRFVSSVWSVKHLDTDGSVLHTYSVGTSVGSAPRIALALDDPDSFWLMSFPTGRSGATPGTSRFRLIDVATGTASVDETVDQKEAALTPTPEFGPAQSCPLLVMPVGFSPPIPPVPPPIGTTVTDPIRRIRRAPHLWDGESANRIFYPGAQLLAETGAPRNDLASDLHFGLRWSDDGGYTWSSWQWVNAGTIGQYRKRAIWRRLGHGRDRIFEVVNTDPAKVVLLDFLLDPDPVQGNS